MPLFDATTAILEHSMNVRLDRQNLLASNLANANTPGYIAKDLDFEKVMRGAAQQLESASGSPPAPIAAPPPDRYIESLDSLHVASLSARPGSEGLSIRSLSAPAPELDSGPSLETVGGTLSLDNNRVDRDHAMVALAANAINYDASAKTIGKKLAILSYVASDGQG